MKPFYTNIQRVGNRFWLRMTYECGRDVNVWVDDYQPMLYVKTNEESDYKTVDGDNLKQFPTEGVKHAKELLKKYEGINGFEFYGNPLWEYSYLYDVFGHRLKYNAEHIHHAIIDIETTVGENSTGFPYPFQALESITLITHYYKGCYHVFSWKEFDVTRFNTHGLNIHKHVFNNEDDMLRAYVSFWQGNYPHAVSGWNTDGFDIPYIINRVKQRLGHSWASKLSPIGQVRLEFAEDDPKIIKHVGIRGIELLDYLLMYKKYSPGERDFSLDSFAEDFLNENKVENPTGDSFRAHYTGEFDFYGEPENEVQVKAKRRTELKKTPDDPEYQALDQEIKRECWDSFVWYNIRDVDIVHRLDKKLGMLNLSYTIAYLVGMNYGDVFGTVKPWDIFLQNENAKKNRFIPTTKPPTVMPRPLMGGYVHLYKPGLYKDGVTLDATSLK